MGWGAVSSRDESDIGEVLNPTRLVERVAAQAMHLIAGAEGVLIGFADDRGVTYVSGAGYLLAHVGTVVDMDTSLSGYCMRSRSIVRSPDTETDPRVDLATCRRLGVASSVCVPLCRGDDMLGVMAVSSSRPDAFCDQDVALLTQLADSMSIAVGLAADLARVGRDLSRLRRSRTGADRVATTRTGEGSASRFVLSVLRPDAVALMEARSRIESILEHPELLTMVFQPIVDVESERTLGVEALARVAMAPDRTPDRWFDEAHRVGLGAELEMLAVTKALAHRPVLPVEMALTINVGPETIMTAEFADALRCAHGGPLVVELTEHSRVPDYVGLMTALRSLRELGVRLAIDDTGAGFSSLSHILKLAPDYIKLDRDLVAGIDVDPVRRALASSLVTFAAGTGSDIVAEGVETQSELDALVRLGIRYAQGYHLGEPTPLDRLVPDARARRRRSVVPAR